MWVIVIDNSLRLYCFCNISVCLLFHRLKIEQQDELLLLVFLSPILLFKKWATPKTAAATAALFIWANSLAGLCGAVASGQLVIEMGSLLPFVSVVLVGGIVGSRFGATVAPQQIIQKLLVVVLIIAAMRRMLEMIGLWA